MSRIGVFICHCGENISRTVDVERVAAGGKPDPRGGVRHRLQVHVLRPGAEPPEEGGGRAEAGRPGGGRLLPAHAREDLPERRQERGAEPVSVRDGQHPGALLLGPRRPGRGDRQGDRHRHHARRAGQEEQKARPDHRPDHQAGAGHRRRHRRDPGGPGHRRLRPPGAPGGAGTLHRRAHGPALRDLPDPGLLPVHHDPQDGRCGQPPQHHPPYLRQRSRASTATSATSRSPSGRRRAASTWPSAPAAASA